MKNSSIFTVKNRTDARGIYRITLIVFIALSLLGVIPYMVSGYASSFADALFESVSGLTTTGASCVNGEAYMPMGLIIYRSFTQWLGGALILVFLASLLRSFDTDSSINSDGNAAQLYRTGIRFGNIAFRLLSTYLSMTAICFAALLISGLKPAGALIYALSVVSTGGCGAGQLVNLSLPNGTETVILIFMMLTCISYTTYYHIIKKHFDKIQKSSELFTYLLFLVAGSVLVVISLKASGTMNLRDSVHYGIFETVSHTTTTGINITDISEWPSFAKFILSLLTYTGGCMASLGSGLKIMRVIILGKLIARSFISRIHPNSVVAIKMNGKPVSSTVLKSVVAYFLAMTAFFIAGAFIIAFEAPSLDATIHITSYLITNTGGGILTGYSGFMKVIMCILMLAGRLEFYALLIPFTHDGTSR